VRRARKRFFVKTRPVLLIALGFCAAIAACSGNIGGGGQTSLPPLPGASSAIAQVTQPAASASPKAASAAVTYTSGVQPLPAIGGIGGTVAFHAPTPAPSASPITISVTSSLIAPDGGPQFDELQNGKKKTKAKGPYPKPLLFVSLQATKDITLDQYPRFAFDVPAAEVAALGKNPQFGLALFDSSEKVHYYRLAAAELDLATAAPTTMPTSTLPTATPKPSPKPSGSALPVATAAPTAGPIHVAFQPTASDLKLVANKIYVFAVYASIPIPASPSPSAAASGSPAAKGTAMPSAGSIAPVSAPNTPSSPSAPNAPSASASPSAR
jgi:hypothetical protein